MSYEHDPHTYVPMAEEQLVQALHYLESGMGVAESVRTALAGYELSGQVVERHTQRVRDWWKRKGPPSDWPDPTTLPRGQGSRPPAEAMPPPPGGTVHIMPTTRSPRSDRKYGKNRPREAPTPTSGGEILDDDQDGVIVTNGYTPEMLLDQPHHIVLEHLLDCQLRVLDYSMAKGDKHQATAAIGSASKLSRELKLERAALKRAGLADRTAQGLGRRLRDDQAVLRSIDAMIAYAEGKAG